MTALTRSVGPVIDLSDSPAFNLEWLRTLEWSIFLIQHGRLRSFIVEPPCATFSSTTYPALRSYEAPRGFNPTQKRTLLATILARRSLALLLTALIGILEQPRLSKMAWLKDWRRLLEVRESFTLPRAPSAVVALAWVIAASRRDLLLPQDIAHTVDAAYLAVQEPKTRFKAARHQSAKLDQPNLWPMSVSTLRARFNTIIKRLQIDVWEGQGNKGLDVGSLRARGASWLLNISENAELVRRRGRWLHSRTMEVYIQEISSLQLLHKLRPAAKHKA